MFFIAELTKKIKAIATIRRIIVQNQSDVECPEKPQKIRAIRAIRLIRDSYPGGGGNVWHRATLVCNQVIPI